VTMRDCQGDLHLQHYDGRIRTSIPSGARRHWQHRKMVQASCAESVMVMVWKCRATLEAENTL